MPFVVSVMTRRAVVAVLVIWCCTQGVSAAANATNTSDCQYPLDCSGIPISANQTGVASGFVRTSEGVIESCPITTYCMGENGAMNPTPPFGLNPNLKYCPVVCPGGYYCPTSAQLIACPSGHYCPTGTVKPRKCSPLSLPCPEGADKQRLWTAALFTIMVPIILYASLQVLRWNQRRHWQRDRTVWHRETEERKDSLMLKAQLDERLQSKIMPMELEIASKDGTATSHRSKDDLAVSVPSPAASTANASVLDINIEFDDLGLTLPNGLTILAGVTGYVRAGTVTAIMGPSGAGKTTFLSVLSGKAVKTSGSIRINGREDRIENFKRVVGFVPQEDVMFRMLTVYENLMYSANVRLPSDWPTERRKSFVEDTVDLLGLRRVRNSIIGDEYSRGVSGGQRKRVNIGMEMVANPRVLFLDEPTSGLDSTSSLTVIAALKKIAQERNVCIATVLHQPRYEIVALFDELLLLGVGGKTVYIGSVDDVGPYFKSIGFTCPSLTNPADFYMDVIAGMVQTDGGADFDGSALFELWSDHVAARNGVEAQHLRDAQRASDAAERERRMSSSAPVSSRDVAIGMPGSAATAAANSPPPLPQNKGCCVRVSEFFASVYANLVFAFGADPSAAVRENARFHMQFYYAALRTLRLYTRNTSDVVMTLFMFFLGGTIIGIAWTGSMADIYEGLPYEIVLNYPAYMATLCPSDEIPSLIADSVMVLAVASAPAAVKSFGNYKVQYWREFSTGSSKLAYFLGVNIVDCLLITLYSLVGFGSVAATHSQMRPTFGKRRLSELPMYAAVSFFVLAPLGSFSGYYGGIFVYTFCVYGFAYFCSMLLSRESMSVTTVVLALIYAISNGAGPTKNQANDWGLGWFFEISYVFRCANALWWNEVVEYQNVYDVSYLNAETDGYDLNKYSADLGGAFLLGVFFRAIAFLSMVTRDQEKQR